MIRLLLVLVLALLLGEANAQQLPQWSQYNFNYYLQNPALGGLDVPLVTQVGYRKQWAGFESAPPTTAYVSMHAPINYVLDNNVHHKMKPHHGVGGYIFQDQAGLNTFTGVNFSYSYHMNITRERKLSFGSFFGFKQYKLEGSAIEFTQSDIDPSVLRQDITTTLPDGAFGVWYHSPSFFAGFSWNQIMNSSISFVNSEESSYGRLKSHYVMNLGWIIEVDKHVKLVPSALLKYVSGAPVQVDLSAKTVFDEKYWVSGSVRNLDAVVGAVGFIYENFEIGYAFDFTLNDIQKSSFGSHEIILEMYLPKSKELTCPSRFW